MGTGIRQLAVSIGSGVDLALRDPDVEVIEASGDVPDACDHHHGNGVAGEQGFDLAVHWS